MNRTSLNDGRVEVRQNNQQAYVVAHPSEGGSCVLAAKVDLSQSDLGGAYGGFYLAMTDDANSALFATSRQDILSVRLITVGPHAGKLQLKILEGDSGWTFTQLSGVLAPRMLSGELLISLEYNPASLTAKAVVSSTAGEESVSVSAEIPSGQVGQLKFTAFGFGVSGYKSGTVGVDEFVLKLSSVVPGPAAALRRLLQGAPLDVYICAGQSNMLGSRSQRNQLPDSLQAVQREVFVFDGVDWLWLEPPEKGFGPEVTFADVLSQQSFRPIGIIKHSKGGTSLAVDWDPDDPNSLYAGLKNKVHAACESRSVKIKGMIWMQGERDSREEEKASAYAENLAHLIQTARADFSAPDMPFVAGRVNPLYPYVDLVRSAQEDCMEKAYAYINCDDLPKNDDHLHYTTAGQIELGKRFAETMLGLE
ncbi:sialate O-acetylesterase [Tichowtungia aerotolerans]|uniref:Sialate O-acetylesterase domain-containing protein n=1 Tax=Tichowtungia aerotolerans TaxID=2697043 RepID=A0A6P1MA67_9BACT|nr:sialate O-acetylesterase [Tichowtungia aerotolerans]QHI70721.1 hypothetical protein GT409_15160 [Tichowtungia aerotolerans]